MRYQSYSGCFKELYLKLNKVKEEDLDTSSFIINKEDENLLFFKLQILSLKNKKTLIVGDYDCDGICSTTIIKRLFEYLNIDHNYYIPSRIKDGYGLNNNIVQMAKDNGFEALFLVDNGIVATDALSLAKELGLSVLIIDHHEYKEAPICKAYIHPNLLTVPYQNLSAGGLCYLVSSLFYEDDYSLVLGGLATYGDMVGVLGFNRYLLQKSMTLLQTKKYYQINLLNDDKVFDYDSLSFNVIPKINAISRMNYNPNILVKYLLADETTCLKTITSINEINQMRKDLTSELLKEIDKQIDDSSKIIIVVSEKISEGLCGLLANRLVNNLNKPIMVFSKKDNVLKGSCRSVEGFNLYEYLSGIKEIFTSFGGHELAIGLSLNEDKLVDLENYIKKNEVVVKEITKNIIEINERDLNNALFNEVESLKPFGVDLIEPLFVLNNQETFQRTLMANKYLKLNINHEASAISFNVKHTESTFTKIVGHLKKDNYNPKKINLLIEDLLN